MDLQQIRARIDEVDENLVALFRERMGLSAQVADYKAEHHLPVLNKAREREVLARVSELAGEDLEAYSRLLYSVLFDMSRAYQQKKLGREQSQLAKNVYSAALPEGTLFPARGVVACQGVEGAYSQHACDKLFAAPNILYFRSFEGVFQAVANGLCQYGILPIENSSAGSVVKVYDLMNRHKFHIVRSVRLHIHHQLMAKPGVKLEQVKEVFSHEQALSQCSLYFEQHSNLKTTPCENTAVAAQMAAQSQRDDVAAICSPDCAELYGLQVLDDHVQNNSNNYTRFICIARELAIYPGADRISLMLSVPHKPGSLYNMIAKFSVLGLNLTKLESRPIPGSDFEFLFYVDLEASIWRPEVMELLSQMAQTDGRFVFLGCYSEV